MELSKILDIFEAVMLYMLRYKQLMLYQAGSLSEAIVKVDTVILSLFLYID